MKPINILEYVKHIVGLSDDGYTWHPNAETIAVDTTMKALEENQKYHKIGTPDECLIAMNKQKPIKPNKEYSYKAEENWCTCASCGAPLG